MARGGSDITRNDFIFVCKKLNSKRSKTILKNYGEFDFELFDKAI